jgi:lysophospholipase L1-like esterase
MQRFRLGYRAIVIAGLAVGVLACSETTRPDDASPPSAGAGGTLSGSGGAASGGANPTSGGSLAGGGVTGGTASQAGSSHALGGAGSDSGGIGMGGGGTGGGGAGASGAGGGGGSSGTAPSVPLDPALLSQCTGTKPIVCHLPAPDGNWDVTVDLGSDSVAGTSRVAAETRHVYGDARPTAIGAHQLVNFTVNVRMEQHDGEQSAPSNVLDLTIDGSAPTLRGVGLRAAPKAITIFVAGDSTLCDWLGTNTSAVSDDETGWGQALAQYFSPGVAVANYADSGETAGSFYGKFFPPAKAALKAGDYLFVQFGHNDQKSATDIANYKTNLMKYVTDARAKNATPVLFTPVSRSSGSDADPGFEGLDQQVRDLAAAEQVAYVDLTVLSRNYYKTVPDKKLLFVDSGTHLTSLGANAVAGLVSMAVKGGELPLKNFVR